MIIAEVMLKKTYLGRELYLVGTNVKMADVSGINSKRVILSVYVLSGILASLAGMIYIARMGLHQHPWEQILQSQIL